MRLVNVTLYATPPMLDGNDADSTLLAIWATTGDPEPLG